MIGVIMFTNYKGYRVYGLKALGVRNCRDHVLVFIKVKVYELRSMS